MSDATGNKSFGSGLTEIMECISVYITYLTIYFFLYPLLYDIGLVPVQDGPFSYTRSHLSAF